MKRKSVRLMAFGILSTFVALTDSNSIAVGQMSQKYQPKVGEAHPEFSLPSIDDGAIRNLSDFRGKKVLLFHFASW